MKICGVIAEFNPFHNGHGYLMDQVRNDYDQVIVVMSGDFVQRGEPAIMSKRIRTECALIAGADLVLELPVQYSTASAEGFAFGGVALLDSLNVVDNLVFGAEDTNLSLFERISELLLQEPKEYTRLLSEGLRKGLSFPAAREQALVKLIEDQEVSSFLRAPNNILGIEYIKALKYFNSSIIPSPITRIGDGYNETSVSSEYPSASAIRRLICCNRREGSAPDPKLFDGLIPSKLKPLLFRDPVSWPVEADDFSALLHDRIMFSDYSDLMAYAEIDEDLARRICNNRNKFTSVSAFTDLLKNKAYTRNRISRCLIHILTGITKDYIFRLDSPKESRDKALNALKTPRVLGFRKSAVPLFAEIKRRSAVKLITGRGDYDSLTEQEKASLDLSLNASSVYKNISSKKYHIPFVHDFSEPTIIK